MFGLGIGAREDGEADGEPVVGAPVPIKGLNVGYSVGIFVGTVVNGEVVIGPRVGLRLGAFDFGASEGS